MTLKRTKRTKRKYKSRSNKVSRKRRTKRRTNVSRKSTKRGTKRRTRRTIKRTKKTYRGGSQISTAVDNDRNADADAIGDIIQQSNQNFKQDGRRALGPVGHTYDYLYALSEEGDESVKWPPWPSKLTIKTLNAVVQATLRAKQEENSHALHYSSRQLRSGDLFRLAYRPDEQVQLSGAREAAGGVELFTGNTILKNYVEVSDAVFIPVLVLFVAFVISCMTAQRDGYDSD